MANHKNTAEFAKGDISEENKAARMVHVRVPNHIYDQLREIAYNNEVSTGRVIIEILRQVAEKRRIRQAQNAVFEEYEE